MLILFCEDPLRPRAVEGAFEHERDAAAAAGFSYAVVNLEFLAQRPSQAVWRVPEGGGEALYRGWMMSPDTYSALFAALEARGVTLETNPTSYQRTHQLPGWYAALEGETPRSIWFPGTSNIDLERVAEAVGVLGHGPCVVKDYVKSRKHEWLDACFIPVADDRAEVRRVVSNFITRQGQDLAGGLVFREFAELESVGAHPRSGMPLSNEWRLFYFRGKRIGTFKYWEHGTYPDDRPPLERFDVLARKIESPFFAMDVARKTDGTWLVIEVGDGQVSGLPTGADATELYPALARATSRE